MATTVSERPQTRRPATGWRNPWLLLALAGLCVGFAAQSQTMWLTLLATGLLAGLYTKVARPRLHHKVMGDNVIIDRPPDWAPPTAKLYRDGRTEYAAHVARARYDETKELIASFGQITWPYLRFVAVPSIASKVVRLLDIASSYRPRRSHVVAAGAIMAFLIGLVSVQIGPAGLANISKAAGLGSAAVAAMMVVSYFMIPNPTTTEGGRVMNDDANNANKHGAEVPTSASEFQRPDGREDTPTNITRQSLLDGMPKAAGTFVGTDTVGMSTEEIAAEMAAPPQHSVLTEERPDADDPLGLGAIDADLAGLIGADLSRESPVGSPSDIWDDDVVSTGSRPTEGDTSAAHWAAEASESEEEGDLPDQRPQAEEDPDIVTARRYWLSLWPPVATSSVAFVIMLFSFFFRATASTGALAYILFISACVVMIGVPIVRQIGELGEYIRLKLRPDNREKLSKQAVLKITAVCLAVFATGFLVWTLGLRPQDIWIVLHPLFEMFRWVLLAWFESMPTFTIGLFLITVVQLWIAWIERRKRPLVVDRDKLSVPTGLIFQRGPSVRFEHITDFEPRQTLGLKWVTVTYNTPEMDQSVRNVFWVPIQFAKLIERRMAES